MGKKRGREAATLMLAEFIRDNPVNNLNCLFLYACTAFKHISSVSPAGYGVLSGLCVRSSGG